MREWGVFGAQTGQKCTRRKKKVDWAAKILRAIWSRGHLPPIRVYATGSTSAQLLVVENALGAIHLHDLLPLIGTLGSIEITPGQRTNYISAKYCPQSNPTLLAEPL